MHFFLFTVVMTLKCILAARYVVGDCYRSILGVAYIKWEGQMILCYFPEISLTYEINKIKVHMKSSGV